MHDVSLQGMRFHALVGILPHERTVAQPIEIDLRVRVDDDDVVIDYRALYDIVASITSSGPMDYLEQIARRVADGAIAHSARIRSARVAVRKPHVALPGPLAYAEVVVERTADD
jgi:dihydroneopterin aldolase